LKGSEKKTFERKVQNTQRHLDR